MLLVGCGKKELPQQQVYPAKGKITWGGEPVRFAMVAFQPVDSTVGVNAFARTEADGSFVLWTYANDEPDGAVPGEYKVTLSNYDPVEGGALPPGGEPTTLPAGFNPEITVEIRSGDNDLQIDIP